MSDPLPSRVAIGENVLFEELQGEAVVLNLNNDQYYGLDDVGTRIWQLLQVHGDTAKVIEALQAEYPGQADVATLRADLAELITKLAAAGLVTVVP